MHAHVLIHCMSLNRNLLSHHAMLVQEGALEGQGEGVPLLELLVLLSFHCELVGIDNHFYNTSALIIAVYIAI